MTNDELTLLQKGRVPAEAILPHVLDYLGRCDYDRPDDAPVELALLCERQGLEYGTVAKAIYRWNHPENPDGPLRSLDFDTADKLLCGTHKFDMWRGELIDYYYAVDLSWCKCQAPGCEKMFRQGRVKQGPTVKRYCSKSCADAHSRIKLGQTKKRHKNYGSNSAPRRGNKCRNNHERTPENTKYRSNGKMECLLCHRASAKRAYEKKMRLKRESLVAT